MPYNTIQDLPKSVKDHTPKHAQEIYMEAFNHAWEEYKDESKRKTEESLEQICHKIAWSAVKKKYHKKDSQWTEN